MIIIGKPLRTVVAIAFLSFLSGAGAAGADWPDIKLARRFGELALSCVHREYPNKIAHVLNSDADVKPPRELTPAFYGCYDWHSAVHGHWLLVKIARSSGDLELGRRVRKALRISFRPDKLLEEARYLEGSGRVSFERPYGLAWFLQLAAELREWDDKEAKEWSRALLPLEQLAVKRLGHWIPKLTHPIRIGEHSQTAFAFGLIFDWSVIAKDADMEALIRQRSRHFYQRDQSCPLSYEPSGHDFLSPCLAEADLMRRIMPPEEFGDWLGAFLPQAPLEKGTDWLEPVSVSDPGDPKLAHLDGLNLSRAWMLEGVASGLPAGDARKPVLLETAERHLRAGLSSVTGDHYEGAHWLGSFAVYLLSRRGIPY